MTNIAQILRWSLVLNDKTWGIRSDHGIHIAENTYYVVEKEIYYRMAYPHVFVWIKLLCLCWRNSKFVDNFNRAKMLNLNTSNRRSPVQWYFPLQSLRVFCPEGICLLCTLSVSICVSVCVSLILKEKIFFENTICYFNDMFPTFRSKRPTLKL